MNPVITHVAVVVEIIRNEPYSRCLWVGDSDLLRLLCMPGISHEKMRSDAKAREMHYFGVTMAADA
jgi:hypothetical protein